MKSLNLDPAFKPLSFEEVKYESFTFAGGEPHIKIDSTLTEKEVVITHRIKSFSDIGLLLLSVDALKRMGVENLHLVLPYFPAARQDRLMIPGEPLSVKVYADIINAQGFSSVRVFDPHSEVTPALLDNCITIPKYTFIDEVLRQIGEDVLFVSPDGEA